MKITKADLYHYLQAQSLDCETREDYAEGYDGKISQEAWDYLATKKHKAICVSWAMSDDHVVDHDMVSLAEDVIEATQGWQTVVTWYGPDSEVLVAGIHGCIGGGDTLTFY